MESIENRLFDLLEGYTWEALSEDDKLFVLTHMTKQEFRNQQKIIVSADELEYPKAVPLPLNMPNKKGGFWMTSVPLYQIALAAAAVIFAVILLWPKNTSSFESYYLQAQNSEKVYETKIVHDTVYQFIEKEVPVAITVEPETLYVYQESRQISSPKRMLEVSSSNSTPVIDADDLTTNTKSMKDDETVTLLPVAPEFGL